MAAQTKRGKPLIIEVGFGAFPLPHHYDLMKGQRYVGVELPYEQEDPMQHTVTGTGRKLIERLAARGHNVAHAEADAKKLPFPDASASRVHFHNVFSDPSTPFEAKEAMVREALRVLKPGGRIVLFNYRGWELGEDEERLLKELPRDRRHLELKLEAALNKHAYSKGEVVVYRKPLKRA